MLTNLGIPENNNKRPKITHKATLFFNRGLKLPLPNIGDFFFISKDSLNRKWLPSNILNVNFLQTVHLLCCRQKLNFHIFRVKKFMTSVMLHIQLVVFYINNVRLLFFNELEILFPELFYLLRNTRIIPNVKHL